MDIANRIMVVTGGASGIGKALAEAFHVQVVPHNPLSPVSTAVCVQLAASIPNFAIQELPTSEEKSPKRDIVTRPLTVRDGYLLVDMTLARSEVDTGNPPIAQLRGRYD